MNDIRPLIAESELTAEEINSVEVLYSSLPEEDRKEMYRMVLENSRY